jgi:hypothetical protein
MPLRRGRDHGASRAAATVLVVGTDEWGVEQAVTLLEKAGRPTLTCHPAGEPAFPCNALVAGRTCPLDAGFDIALTVRATPSATPTQGEMGVVCALHAGVPLVTAGIRGRNPFHRWAVREVDSRDDLAEVIDEVAHEHLRTVDLRDAPVGDN